MFRDDLSASPHGLHRDLRLQMNVSDSELMLGSLAARGTTRWKGRRVRSHPRHTCAIRAMRSSASLAARELRRHMKADTVMGGTGCMAQRLGPQILERAAARQHRHRTRWYAPFRRSSMARARDGVFQRRTSTSRSITRISSRVASTRSRRGSRCSEGCDYRCTYASPTTRGPERSRQLADVVRETEPSWPRGCPRSCSWARR